MPERGKLFVVSGPSGVGKDTVLGQFLPSAQGFVRSVSATTRPRRPGETDGVDYSFVNREQFAEMLGSGEILEHTVYNGSCYGTPRSRVEELLAAGKSVVLKIEVDGAAQIRRLMPEAVLIFIGPPSLDVLAGRLQLRQSESAEEQGNRFVISKMELHRAKNYDYIIVNDDVEASAAMLRAIAMDDPAAETARVGNMREYIREVCENA